MGPQKIEQAFIRLSLKGGYINFLGIKILTYSAIKRNIK